jgi:hypothetical protein
MESLFKLMELPRTGIGKQYMFHEKIQKRITELLQDT